MKRASLVLVLILAFCGLAESVYFVQYEGGDAPNLLGIPLAELGVLSFTILFVLAALVLARPLFSPTTEFPKRNIQMPPAL